MVTAPATAKIHALLESALTYTRGAYDALGILDGHDTGKFRIWADWEHGTALLVTEIHPTQHVKYLHVFLAAGSRAALQPLIKAAWDDARTQGCQRVSFTGRLGWARSWAKELGFQVTSVCMEAEL